MSLPTEKWIPPPFFIPHPISPLIAHHMLEKVSLKVFRQILSKVLPVVHIFSFIIAVYMKKLIGIKSLSTKQCPAELSPWIIPPVSPILPKMYYLLSSCLLPLLCVDCPVDGGRILSISKKMSISCTRKISLTNTNFIYSSSHCCWITFF